ncbi:MAG: GntR family transcriptional regulator [Actinomycetota bacterium]|jgi:DNA-binding GntR family transcriptional regulator
MARLEAADGYERQRKGDAVYWALKRQLLRGEYPLGASLSVAELVVSVRTSRQPVMEALKRLQAEGFVEIIPQVGCRVATPSPEEARDFYEVFATMEGLVSRLAAERRRPEAVEEIRYRVARLQDAFEGGRFDNARYAELNRAFHSSIHRCANSREARIAAEMYWDRSDFLIGSTRPPFWRTNMQRAEGEHEALLRAVEVGDGAAAQSVAYSHIRSFGEAVAQHLLSVDGASLR